MQTFQILTKDDQMLILCHSYLITTVIGLYLWSSNLNILSLISIQNLNRGPRPDSSADYLWKQWNPHFLTDLATLSKFYIF